MLRFQSRQLRIKKETTERRLSPPQHFRAQFLETKTSEDFTVFSLSDIQELHVAWGQDIRNRLKVNCGKWKSCYAPD